MIFKSNFRSIQNLISILVFVSISLSNLGFNKVPVLATLPANPLAPSCSEAGSERLLSLDGVDLTVCFPFSPEIMISAAKNEMVQSAYAVNHTTRQELSIYVVPYGLQPAADNLPVSEPGIAGTYQDLSFQVYEGQILSSMEAQPINLFGQTIPGRSVVIAYNDGSSTVGQQLITQWVVEAGGRVWLVRFTSYAVSFKDGLHSTALDEPIALLSSNLDKPSTSLEVSREPSPAREPDVSISAADLPTPAWWSGNCDVNNFPESFPLGASYRGVKTCGPFNSYHLVNFGVGYGQYEWQCVEYVKRYLYLAYGIAPYSANGNTVVSNYQGTRLEKVLNGTPNKGPSAGDVISFTGPSTYGHASLVSAAVIDANGNGTITIAEQNYSKTGARTLGVSNWSINSSDGVYGWLHDNQVVDNPPAGFIKCANEGGVCGFSGTADVVYGARNSFTTPRSFTSAVDCNSTVFGDPISGVAKACYAKPASGGNTQSWSAKYFSGQAHWLDDTNLDNQMCVETLVSNGLDKNYGAVSPCTAGVVENWVAEYNTTVDFAPGNYVFQAQNDDGLKVWVNGESIFDRASTSSLSSACPARSLSGNTPIRVILRQDTGNALVRLVWTTDTSLCAPPGSFVKIGPPKGATGLTTSPRLSWAASSGVNAYSYCIDTINNNACDTSWQDVGNLTSKTLSGLAYNSTYYWQVRSSNIGGETLANGGTWWSFTTQMDPASCYSLTRSHTGNGADPVATPENSSNCASGQYRVGEMITLNASPASGYRVGSWSATNDNASTADTNQLSMPSRALTIAVNYIQAAPETPVTLSPDGLVNNDLHPIYKWTGMSGATSYLLTVYNEDQPGFPIYNLRVPASVCNGTPKICSYHPLVELGNYNYAFQVAAVNITGSSQFSPWRVFYIAKRVTSFESTPLQDGYIRESTQTSEIGGAIAAAGVVIVVGDDGLNRQFRSILSFDTTDLPDNAVILSATLKLTKHSILGTDPFSTHGLLIVDIRTPYFGPGPGLQLADFAAGAAVNRAGVVSATPVKGFYVANLVASGLLQINKVGTTQLRLRFAQGDDYDNRPDYLRFYSGETLTQSFRPVLEISYYVP